MGELMLVLKRIFFLSVLTALPSFLHSAGIFLYEVATPDLGLASSGWSARAEDASTAFTNPAGMTRLKRPQVSLGVEPIYQHIKYHPNSKTNVKGNHGNGSQWIPSGSLFYVHPLNDRVSVGFANVGYFGAKVNYGKHWVGRYYCEKALTQAFSAIPSIAVRVTEKLSLGVGINISYGMMESKSAIHNILDNKSDGSVKIKDNRFGVGAIVGALYEFSPRSRIGIQYLSQVKLRFRDKPKFHNLGKKLHTVLDKGGLLDSTIKVNMHIPNSVMLSMYQGITSKLAVLANFGWQQWTNLANVEVALSSGAATSLANTPKYRNTRHVALGFEYFFTPCFKGTCGMAYDTSVVNRKNRTFGFPIGQQKRYGAGFQYTYKNCDFNISYELMRSGDLKIIENKGPFLGRVAGRMRNLDVHYYAFEFMYRF
jgi:long-chain fatty acid transport protein